MNKKCLFAMMAALVICNASNAMESITDFKKADEFGVRIMEIVDAKAAQAEVEKAFAGISESSVSKDLKIGLIEKIKDDLSSEFPFVTRMAETYIQKVTGSNLYEVGIAIAQMFGIIPV
jgi:hypothetical protein